jgi:hypothetical protein
VLRNVRPLPAAKGKAAAAAAAKATAAASLRLLRPLLPKAKAGKERKAVAVCQAAAASERFK